MEYTEQLANYITEFSIDWADFQVVEFAQWGLLDFLSVCVAGKEEPSTKIIKKIIEQEGGKKNCRLLGGGLKGGLKQAVLYNAVSGHVLDFDDVLPEMHGHPSVCILPTCLAVAEIKDMSILKLLEAYILGIEITGRVGLTMGGNLYARGWHATGIVGAFGSLASAAKLLGLNAEQVQNAIGILVNLVSGLQLGFGTMTKHLVAGRAAENGLSAVMLAQENFRGARGGLDIESIFFKTYNDKSSLCAVVDRSLFFTKNLIFKEHAACFGIHSIIEGLKSLIKEKSLKYQKITRIQVHLNPAMENVCRFRHPETIEETKFSIPHNVALVLSGKDTTMIETYREMCTLNDSKIHDIREKVSVFGDKNMSRYQSCVQVTTVSGEVYKQSICMDRHWGERKNISKFIENKFKKLSLKEMSDEKSSQIINWVLNIESKKDVRQLVNCF